jgi:branched-subunit amino acid ABC-type transport system permease component
VLLGLVESYGGYYMGASWQAALPYIFLLLVMLVRPQGLQLGQRLRAGQA